MRHASIAVALALFAGVAAISAWSVSAALAQPNAAQPSAAPAVARFATLDAFSLAERMMNRDDLRKPRTEIDEKYRPQIQAIESGVQDLNARLQQLEQTPSDPQVRPLLQQREQRFQEYQQLVQTIQREKEALNASQLGTVYREIRTAAQAHAQKNGYTHVVANRAIERTGQAPTVADAFQDMVARPFMVSPAGHDITAAIAAVLNVDLSAPLPDPNQPAAPAAQQPPAPAPAPQR